MDDIILPTGFIQANRVLKLSSPLGEDQLLPERMTVDEGVNRLFEIKLSVRAKREAVKPDELIGHLVDVSLEIRQGEFDEEGLRRPFNGLVTDLEEGPPVTRGLRSYTLTIRPQMWLLSRRSDCRIWQDMTSVQVLETLFSEHGLPAPDIGIMHNKPPAQIYSVQWNESDLDYLLRRLQEDGIFFWFLHEPGQHRLRVTDHQIGWSDPSESAEGEERVRIAQGSSDRNHITEWMRRFRYIPGRRVDADWNFETPGTVPRSTTPSMVQMPGSTARELYEYPARISDHPEAERAGKLRAQASEADHERVTGSSTVRILEPGRRFTPYEEPNPEHEYEEYVITRIVHEVVDRSYETVESQPEYGNHFEALPARLPLTPHRSTPRPRIEGAQVAIVAGPEGEEIHPDKYGRIKLWFPWDRRAKKDGSDTCWVRVSQSWAGGLWGSQVIPRIGMEVMVAFIDGDPDRPLVTGVVPNPHNPVPYELPGNKTRSVFKTKTHKGYGFNELRFEDASAREEIFMHAQRDFNTEVRNNETKNVGGNQHTQIMRNLTKFAGGFEAHYSGLGYMVATQGTLSLSAGRASPISVIDPAFFSSGGTILPHFTNLLTDVEENIAYRPGSISLNSAAECAVHAAGDVAIGAQESVSISAQESVTLSSSENIRLTAGQSIITYAGGNFVLASDSAMILRAGAAEIILNPNGEISIKGTTITLQGEKICLN
ncbi:type VI secretion system tip protein TssI/VgrG [Rhizobium paknamense]|uniref:Type VI secretion system secreted protein VgrG n=1 Tax=Rhizobium paknamense TaxID=1206817 RepID=A0ABU0ILL5_9HYPH|nr:type VI secretion system tip protein TssI/VgrG [Rhizobium paknamense]MDQ0458079.1 type VI secretion system secreted protein VgrG [Rhizobium paknamense]